MGTDSIKIQTKKKSKLKHVSNEQEEKQISGYIQLEKNKNKNTWKLKRIKISQKHKDAAGKLSNFSERYP